MLTSGVCFTALGWQRREAALIFVLLFVGLGGVALVLGNAIKGSHLSEVLSCLPQVQLLFSFIKG